MLIIVGFLRRMLDTTNPLARRGAYTAGLAASVGCYLWLGQLSASPERDWRYLLPLSMFGVVLLLLSSMDLYLLYKGIQAGECADVER
jgi:hypothetical protein